MLLQISCTHRENYYYQQQTEKEVLKRISIFVERKRWGQRVQTDFKCYEKNRQKTLKSHIPTTYDTTKILVHTGRIITVKINRIGSVGKIWINI